MPFFFSELSLILQVTLILPHCGLDGPLSQPAGAVLGSATRRHQREVAELEDRKGTFSLQFSPASFWQSSLFKSLGLLCFSFFFPRQYQYREYIELSFLCSMIDKILLLKKQPPPMGF